MALSAIIDLGPRSSPSILWYYLQWLRYFSSVTTFLPSSGPILPFDRSDGESRQWIWGATGVLWMKKWTGNWFHMCFRCVLSSALPFDSLSDYWEDRLLLSSSLAWDIAVAREKLRKCCGWPFDINKSQGASLVAVGMRGLLFLPGTDWAKSKGKKRVGDERLWDDWWRTMVWSAKYHRKGRNEYLALASVQPALLPALNSSLRPANKLDIREQHSWYRQSLYSLQIYAWEDHEICSSRWLRWADPPLW